MTDTSLSTQSSEPQHSHLSLSLAVLSSSDARFECLLPCSFSIFRYWRRSASKRGANTIIIGFSSLVWTDRCAWLSDEDRVYSWHTRMTSRGSAPPPHEAETPKRRPYCPARLHGRIGKVLRQRLIRTKWWHCSVEMTGAASHS